MCRVPVKRRRRSFVATVMKLTVLIEPCAYDHIVCRPCERPSGDMLVRGVHEPCPIFGLIRSARHPEMPLFFFHIKENGDVLYDEEGSDHIDLDAAREEAIEGIRQIISDAVLTGSPLGLDREMHIDDNAGHTLSKIMFRDVLDH